LSQQRRRVSHRADLPLGQTFLWTTILEATTKKILESSIELRELLSSDHLRRAYCTGPDNVLHEQLTQATSPKVSVTNILPDAGDGRGVRVPSPETTPTRIDPLTGNSVVGVLVPHHRVGKVVSLAVVGQLPDDGWFGSSGHVDWSKKKISRTYQQMSSDSSLWVDGAYVDRKSEAI
jgi:hypothetical protein